MEVDAAAFAALGHPTRLALFRLLARRAPGCAAAGDIACALGIKPNVASVHLATLARAGLIRGARSGKHVLYRCDLTRAGALIDYLALDCCRGRPELCAPLTAAALRRPGAGTASVETPRPFHALFVCTGNSARSIFAEALLNRLGGGRFRAFSAGAHPRPAPDPLALERLVADGHDVSGLRSKGVAVFRRPDAPPLDAVVTICDRAADEECPPWPGHPVCGHWGLPDPARATGSDAARRRAFAQAYETVRRRVEAFAALPVETLDALALQRAIDRIAVDETSAPSSA